MTERPVGRENAAEDLEYELAHQDHDQGNDRRLPIEHSPDEGSYVGTETPNYAGDYGYDMSHDLP